jgi:hypothetical protein
MGGEIQRDVQKLIDYSHSPETKVILPFGCGVGLPDIALESCQAKVQSGRFLKRNEGSTWQLRGRLYMQTFWIPTIRNAEASVTGV